MAELISLNTVLTGAGGSVVVPFVNKLLGPWVDEVGAAIAEHARIYRLQNSINVLKKAQKLAAEAGIDPKQVNLKVLVPLLEGASLEDNPSLTDKWAALLTNAANPAETVGVKPIYTDILRQLMPEDAQILDQLFERTELDKMVRHTPDPEVAAKPNFRKIVAMTHYLDLHSYNEDKAIQHAYESVIDNLLRQRLIVLALPGKSASTIFLGSHKPSMGGAFFTSLGFDFMLACSPPEALKL
ncbi:Abi-alpha family protein [Hymenobacter sp. ASUV-10]|uniref:Abi-alpha family protein n=1 Tax=Hymenobacter aranciens TaxID=3063996 RepID=A0ABT9BHT5_9BACT|nr:Abi-alpha family protein [Hymenobacter sp. ASUV-10]MDO7877833.1 Abi-alpha family protein [Hymenobacter sp. ASUV-10]